MYDSHCPICSKRCILTRSGRTSDCAWFRRERPVSRWQSAVRKPIHEAATWREQSTEHNARIVGELAITDCRKTKGRGRLGASFRRRNRLRLRLRLRSRFEGNFQRSFDTSFRLSFEASDVRSDALSDETSDARSDEASFEMSDGRSDEVSFRVCVLRYFPANSEASFPTSFQGSFQRDFRLPIVE